MGSIATAVVGLNAQCLAPAPTAGASADVVTVINLDTANTVNLGSSATFLPLQLGPLASVTLTAPVWASAPIGLEVGIVPGGSNYSPGSLTINGPVTAEITGPVEISDIEGGTVTFSNDQIDVTGIGGYVLPGEVTSIFDNVSSETAGPVSTYSFGTWDVSTYASIVFGQAGCGNSSTADGAAICAVWLLEWLDDDNNLLVTDTLSGLLGGSAAWEIPVKGTQLTIALQNIGSVGTITCPAFVTNEAGIYLDGSYRTIPNTRVSSSGPGSGFVTMPGCVVIEQGEPVFKVGGWIANIDYAWSSAEACVVFPLAQWAGQASFWYSIPTEALARNLTIIDLTYAVQGGVAAGTGYTLGIIANISGSLTSATTPPFFTFNLPPTQCAVVIGTPSTAGTFSMGMLGVAN